MFTNWSLQQHLHAQIIIHCRSPAFKDKRQPRREERAVTGDSRTTFEPRKVQTRTSGSVPGSAWDSNSLWVLFHLPVVSATSFILAGHHRCRCNHFLCSCKACSLANQRSILVERPRDRKGRTCVCKSKGLRGAGGLYSTEILVLACQS